MNNKRRQILRSVLAKIEELDTLKEEIVEILTEVTDEEQEAFDNLPENLQMSERGERIEEIIGLLENARDTYEDLEFDTSDIEDAIE